MSLDLDQEYLLCGDGNIQRHRIEVLRRRSPLRTTAVHQPLRLFSWKIIAVALVYSAKVVLGNAYLTYVHHLTNEEID